MSRKKKNKLYNVVMKRCLYNTLVNRCKVETGVYILMVFKCVLLPGCRQAQFIDRMFLFHFFKNKSVAHDMQVTCNKNKM